MSCGGELPGGRRSDMRYCGVRCRVRAHRIRKGEGRHVRPTKKHGHTALKVALGTVAAATAAFVSAELVRKSERARLEEQQQKLASLEEQLRKSQAASDERKRAEEVLRKKAEPVSKETKEQEEQLGQAKKQMETDRTTIESLRNALIRANEESNQDKQRLLEMRRERDAVQQTLDQLSKESGQQRRRLEDANRRIQSLSKKTAKLERQLESAKDKRAAQRAKQLAARGRIELQQRLESAKLEIKTQNRMLRSVRGELSSVTKKLSAKMERKRLTAAKEQAKHDRMKRELAQAKEQIKLLTVQVRNRKELRAPTEKALALANRSCAALTESNERLSAEVERATKLAREWEQNFRHLARRFAELEDQAADQRRIGGSSQVAAEPEKPGFFRRALMAIGLLGTGAVLGVGAVAMLGEEESPKALGAAPERKVLGSKAEQKALGPETQRRLTSRSTS